MMTIETVPSAFDDIKLWIKMLLFLRPIISSNTGVCSLNLTAKLSLS